MSLNARLKQLTTQFKADEQGLEIIRAHAAELSKASKPLSTADVTRLTETMSELRGEVGRMQSIVREYALALNIGLNISLVGVSDLD